MKGPSYLSPNFLIFSIFFTKTFSPFSQFFLLILICCFLMISIFPCNRHLTSDLTSSKFSTRFFTYKFISLNFSFSIPRAASVGSLGANP
ncbi:unnamed protein product [Meloidogyne enterolobii]|uniref:Uncharacterized protein n=1 Tax=Meloidogyne enterolobii TaxID=390850 RepID=A0ACB0YHV8_MELEN